MHHDDLVRHAYCMPFSLSLAFCLSTAASDTRTPKGYL